VIALEHGFARWADFKRWVETREPEPKVGRIGRAPVSSYEERAERLAKQGRAGDADALRRGRHHVPKLADFAGTAVALSDARIVIAREYGFPTWRELTVHVQKAIDEYQEQPDAGGRRKRLAAHARRRSVAGRRHVQRRGVDHAGGDGPARPLWHAPR